MSATWFLIIFLIGIVITIILSTFYWSRYFHNMQSRLPLVGHKLKDIDDEKMLTNVLKYFKLIEI